MKESSSEFVRAFGRVGLRESGDRFIPDAFDDIGADSTLKLEIDPKVASKIGAVDVLRALEHCEIDKGNSTELKIGQELYNCDFIPPKAKVFVLGPSPETTLDISGNFLGTLYVSEKKEESKDMTQSGTLWTSKPSYRRFCRSLPIGCNPDTVPIHRK